MRNGILFGIAVGMFATTWVGCGSVDAPGQQQPPLWTLKGKITNIQQGLEVRHPRVAFVWMRAFDERVIAAMSQDIPLETEFPATFTLKLFDLPPEAAMNDPEDLEESLAGSDFKTAYGTLLVYDDRNANGALDLLDNDAQEAVDYVLGPPKKDWLMAIYVQGGPTGLDLDGIPVEQGLNLFRLVDDSSGDEWATPTTQKLPLDTELEITLVDDPELQRYMCNSSEEPNEGGTTASLGLVKPCVIPENAAITCSSNGDSLFFDQTIWERVSGICSPLQRTEVTGFCVVEPDQPTPDGWPCEP